MTPYYDSGGVTIYHGDAWEVVKELPGASVQTVVTSPPYWGLRDYGTAEWEGGDDGCDHEPNRLSPSSTLGGGKATQGQSRIFHTGCPKCGATRIDSQFGLEQTPEEYVDKLVSLFREIRRVLRDDGTVWLNLGDSYAASGPAGGAGKQYTNAGSIDVPVRRAPHGLKPKDLVGIPWRVAFALQVDGWYLRSDIIWSKPNPMPESVTDRPTKAHEYIFLLSKSARYHYDHEAIKEDAVEGTDLGLLRGRDTGKNDLVSWHAPSILKRQQNGIDSRTAGNGKRNKRTVWTVTTKPYKEAHFATFPPDLIEPCVLAGAPKDGTVLDPFHGSGTTGEVCRRAGRKYIGIELNADYIDMSIKRYHQQEMFT